MGIDSSEETFGAETFRVGTCRAETLRAGTTTLPMPPLPGTIARLSVFLDFDGTLVELAPTPDAIHVAPGLSAMLERLAAHLEGRLAVISGRALADLDRHLGTRRITLSGSHGGELRLAAADADAPPGSAFPEQAHLEASAFAAAHGLLLETKPLGFAFHYRQAPGAGAAVEAFARQLGTRYGLQMKSGKMVAELMPPGIDKGGIVAALMATPGFRGSTPVFIGDDVTDEDGFRAAAAHGGFGVLVGELGGARAETVATARLADVNDVHNWLAGL
ncbi:trehalose-phosphatase [Sphingosinicella microcystinivorans]|uniref:trehalose-phosphatase n=1 Tax=Sphingosinicella microcystinivorans TaxID=335406 RepID=UPI0022F3EC88|nr:trehalose-phosphatase [Sphingosinicella microcystinivorans]WBX84675.1 trehalose-phosphatase [Sphingosinicella microcystinivorans]